MRFELGIGLCAWGQSGVFGWNEEWVDPTESYSGKTVEGQATISVLIYSCELRLESVFSQAAKLLFH